MKDTLILKELSENPAILNYMDISQKSSLAFKMAALNENMSAGLYFGLLTNNIEHNKVLFLKSLEYNKNIGKNAFRYKSKEKIDNILESDPEIARFFENAKEKYKGEKKMYTFNDLYENGKAQDKGEIIKMLSYTPTEYVDLQMPSELVKDPLIIETVLKNIDDCTGFFKYKQELIDSVQNAVENSGYNLTDEKLLAIAKENSYIAKMYSERFEKMIEEKNPECMKLLEEKPIIKFLASDFENEGKNINVPELLAQVLTSESMSTRDFLILKKNMKDKDMDSLAGSEIFSSFITPKVAMEMDFTVMPQSFYEVFPADTLNNIKVLRKAYSEKSNIFPYIGKNLKNDFNIAKAFVELAGRNYRELGNELKNNPEIIKTALSKSASDFYFLPPEQQNRKNALIALEKDKWAFFLFPEALQKDEKVLEKISEQENGKTFSEFFRKAFNIHLKALDLKLRNSAQVNEMLKQIVKLDPSYILDIPKVNEKMEIELWREAIRIEPSVYKTAPKGLREDPEIVEALLEALKQLNEKVKAEKGTKGTKKRAK